MEVSRSNTLPCLPELQWCLVAQPDAACFNVTQGSLRTRDLPVTRHVTSPSSHDGMTGVGGRAGGAVKGSQEGASRDRAY